MKQNQFETTFTDQWQSFEQMLESLENRKQNSMRKHLQAGNQEVPDRGKRKKQVF